MKTGLLLLLFFTALFAQAQQDSTLLLWYRQPARDWNEALPVGNGRLGAMVFGSTGHERIQLNEESIWAGNSIDHNNPGAAAHFKEIQQLLLADSNKKAFDLSTKHLLATPIKFRSYQPLGDLLFDFGQQNDVRGYSRHLDLSTGIVATTYTVGSTTFQRQVFVSAPDNAVFIRLSANTPNSINCKVTLHRALDALTQASQQGAISLEGQILDVTDSANGPGGPGIKFSARMQAKTSGGTVRAAGNSLLISNASDVWLCLTAATDYNLSKLGADRTINTTERCNVILAKAMQHSFESALKRHLAEYQPLFNRVSLQFGKDSLAGKPTNERLDAVKKGTTDNGLMALYFQYGRYLLLGSSRAPGRLPANLQGIWNEHYIAPWNSDYHTNINLQMNYWPAHVGNLSETAEPLHNFIDQYRVPGRVTAQKMYNASGWTMHHATDIFGKTGIVDGIESGTSPLAAAWLCTHLWEHYLFTQDKAFLRTTGYPVIKEAVRFIQSFLIEDSAGQLVTAPSMSPENSFKLRDGTVHQITYAPSIDVQTIMALYDACLQAGAIVGESKAFADSLRQTLKKLPPVQVSKRYGIVQEWIQDYEEAEPGHRHMSQLIGLYPFNSINPKTPALFEAAKKTIERRLQFGGGHTGWSRAWIINFHARLLEGEKAYENVVALLQKSTLPNLFDNHPPFQIDGNFGATAGIAEMLLQSQSGEVHLLPALPNAWAQGSVKGLLARGGFVVDMAWSGGNITTCQVLSKNGGTCTIRYRGKLLTRKMRKGETWHPSFRI